MTRADVVLAHGFRLSDLHRMARQSAATNRTMAADHRDLLDTAWSAIALELYTADTPPSEHDLLAVGKGAIWAMTKQHRQAYGYRDREAAAGMGSAPRWATYWWDFGRPTPSPEPSVVERLTLPRLLAALRAPYRDAIAALAAHDGDREAAAAALGISMAAMQRRIHVARARCLALWLEGETPARRVKAQPDRKRSSTPLAPCGTPAAARRHRARRETLCPECLTAETAARKARRAAA
ncbi:hypothetical protein ACFHW1_05065 [Micromonospora sp. LOL_014]|uniref:hypothetical protein n=1 Tax=Micromonospora sp. LOL_014 TaxID=3345415 RepID=UPI003A876429